MQAVPDLDQETTAEGESDVRLVDVSKRFGDVWALRPTRLDIRRGEFFSLLGASGSGKTTTLRIISGFEEPSGDRVFLRGRDVTDTAPYARNVNTVFQDYALFSHMSVEDNVGYGLRIRRVPKREIASRVAEALLARVVQPLAFPGILAGRIFVFSLTMGDFVTPLLMGNGSQFIGNVIADQFGVSGNYPFGAALSVLPLIVLVVFLTVSRRFGVLEALQVGPSYGRRARLLLGSISTLVYAFLYLPLIIVIIYAFNSATITSWPPSQPSLHWFQVLAADTDPRSAFINSVKVAAAAVVVIAISLPIVLLAQYLTRDPAAATPKA